MKLLRFLTNCSFLRRLSLAAMALLTSIGAAHAQSTNYSATILADSPVAYYQLQELPGASTATDSSSNALDGSYVYDSTDSSPLLGQPGIDSNAVFFSFGPGGLSDYGAVDLPSSALLSPVAADGTNGAPFSAECWVQATTLTNGIGSSGDYCSALSADGPYSGLYANNGTGWNFYQTATTPQDWQLFFRGWSGVNLVGGTPVTLGAWAHLAVTFDGTNCVFYVNGQVSGSMAVPDYLANPGANNIQIGGPGNTGHRAFEGGVTQVAFYTNVLTPAQILNHYNVGTNSIVIPPSAPTFTTEPSPPPTVYSGVPMTLSALVGGTAPFLYQWYSNNVEITGATNNSYTFTPVYPDNNNASYYLFVTNAIGSTNSITNALTVLTNIVVGAPPYSAIGYNVGSHAAFRIAAAGAEPIAYQWYVSSNGASFEELTNQTADTLWLTNVQLSMAGYQYWVVASNPFEAYSNYATLSVQTRPVVVPLTGYGAIVAADDPVAFYHLDEGSNTTVATDAVGSFDAAYINALGPVIQDVPVAIPGETNAGVEVMDTNSTAGYGGYVSMPYALELNPHGNWSFEGWFQPTKQDGVFRTACASMYDSNYFAAVYGWRIYQHQASAWTLVTYDGAGAPAIFQSDFGHYPLNIGSWYHLVITDDGTTVQLWVNGVAGSANGPASMFLANGINGDASDFGGGASTMGQTSAFDYYGFNGVISDVAFYNYALSQSQITHHYLGKASLTPSQVNGQTVLTWPVGTLMGSTNLAGPYAPISGATSPFAVLTTNSQFFYFVSMPQ
jgi:hypothetical protein